MHVLHITLNEYPEQGTPRPRPVQKRSPPQDDIGDDDKDDRASLRTTHPSHYRRRHHHVMDWQYTDVP